MLSDRTAAGNLGFFFNCLLRRVERRVRAPPLYNIEGLELTYLHCIMFRAGELEAKVCWVERLRAKIYSCLTLGFCRHLNFQVLIDTLVI